MKRPFNSLLRQGRRAQFRIILYLKRRGILLGSIANLLFGYYYRAMKFDDINNLPLINTIGFNFISNYSSPLYHCPPEFNRTIAENSVMKKVNGYRIYSGIFKNSRIIGGSNLVIVNKNTAIYDLKENDSNNKFHYSDQGIRYYRNNHFLIKMNNSRMKIEKGIFLVGNFSWNYYHLLFEVLVKFDTINKLNIDDSVPLLVDKICMDIPQYNELITIFNNRNRNIISIEKHKIYEIGELFYTSCPNLIPSDFLHANKLQSEDILFDLKTIDFLRKKLLPYASKRIFPKRIFISRSSASIRRKFNEDEVFELLKKYNVEMVFPEKLSIIDQISLFKETEFIAGGSGAALSNLLFCKPSCKVIVFAKNELPFSGFSTIAKHLSLDMLYFTEGIVNVEDLDNIHESFTINITRLNLLMSEWS